MSSIRDLIPSGVRPGTPHEPGRRSGHVAIALAVALLGFLLAAQFHAHETLSRRLAGEREADLAQLLSDLQSRSDQLVQEVVDLKIRLAASAGSQQQERVLLENAQQQLTSLRILLGLVPVTGEGIQLAITDPQSTVGPDLLVDTVQELRDAGAEAIDVNGMRVVASTAFTGSPGSISAGGAPIQAPYLVTAIGARDTLAQAMRIPGGVFDSIGARHGAAVTLDAKRQVSITSLRPVPRFAYATRA